MVVEASTLHRAMTSVVWVIPMVGVKQRTAFLSNGLQRPTTLLHRRQHKFPSTSQYWLKCRFSSKACSWGVKYSKHTPEQLGNWDEIVFHLWKVPRPSRCTSSMLQRSGLPPKLSLKAETHPFHFRPSARCCRLKLSEKEAQNEFHGHVSTFLGPLKYFTIQNEKCQKIYFDIHKM